MLGGTTLDRYLFDKHGNSKMGSTSYLSKPRIGSRSAYHTHTSDKENSYKNKKTRPRKSIPKMSEYGIKKRLPDYTELAYKEAVSRLRYFLSETYAPSSRSSKIGAPSIKNLDESGDEGFDPLPKSKYPLHGVYSGLRSTSSAYNPVYLPPKASVLATKRYPLYSRENYRSYGNEGVNVDVNLPSQSIPLGDASQSGKPGGHSGDPELMGFIQKQEEYIEQLERESSYCRDELNNLLGKVKEVISENETLHEKQKNHLIASVMDQRSASDSEEEDGEGDSDHKYSSMKSKKSPMKSHSKRLEGPNIVFESKISELEAQLTQANIDLKKMQEENGEIRRKISEGMVDSPSMDGFKRQIENLQRDKSSLEAQVNRLKSSLDDFKDTDSDLVSKAKRSADMVFQANHDKVQLEMEIRRLKEELERQQNRVRELLSEQARRVMEERSAVERRYCSQVEQLTSDLTTHWDSATKLQLELERQKREESDLKRELNQKNSQIEDLKMELKNKVASLQADMAQSHADKSAVEEELANARLMLERHQRQAKHDSNRLNSEIQSVRQRLDRADADLVHSRRENLRLIDQLANMEKEMNLGSLRPSSPRGKEREAIKEEELTGMIQNMEQKHAQTVSELEAMLCSQNGLMEKLTAECHLLTGKLDDASIRHKDEMASLQNKLELLSERVSAGSALYNPAPAMQHAIKTTDNKRATEPPLSRQNSRGLVYDNQHASEARHNGAPTPNRNPRTEPDQRKTSRQPSRSNVVDNSNKRDEEIDERERFEKNFKESGPDKSNPNNSPLGIKKKYDISKVRLENNDREHNLEDDRQFDAQYGNEKMEYDTNQTYDDPNQQYIDPNQAHAEPRQEYIEPNQEYVDPNQQYDDPNQQYVDPNQDYVDPNQQYVDPNQEYVDPNQEFVDPNQEYVDPNQEYTESVDPNQGYTESNDPNQEYTASVEQNQGYTESVDPNQQYADSNQEYADPNQQYAEQNQEYADPNQPYAEQEYADPNQQYATDPSQEITDTNIPDTINTNK